MRLDREHVPRGPYPIGIHARVRPVGRANLQLTAMGLAMGANARAGLEDTLYLRRGELAAGNEPLVRRTIRLAESLDLRIASVDEAAESLGIRA